MSRRLSRQKSSAFHVTLGGSNAAHDPPPKPVPPTKPTRPTPPKLLRRWLSFTSSTPSSAASPPERERSSSRTKKEVHFSDVTPSPRAGRASTITASEQTTAEAARTRGSSSAENSQAVEEESSRRKLLRQNSEQSFRRKARRGEALLRTLQDEEKTTSQAAPSHAHSAARAFPSPPSTPVLRPTPAATALALPSSSVLQLAMSREPSQSTPSSADVTPAAAVAAAPRDEVIARVASEVLEAIMPKLECLDLTVLGWGDDDVCALVALLPRFEAASTLVLSGNDVGAGGAAALAGLLAHDELAALRTLTLDTCSLDPRSVDLLADGLRANTTLTELNLDNNPLDKRACAALASALAAPQSALVTLGLFECRIDGDSVAQLLPALEVNTALEALLMSDNLIGDSGGLMLAAVLSARNRALRKVWLCNNGLSVSTQAALRDAACAGCGGAPRHAGINIPSRAQPVQILC
jgi:hypothetical protein